MNRRNFLRLATLSAAGAVTTSTISLSEAALAPAAAAIPLWPGHKPGRIYLGLSTGESLDVTLRQTGPIGLYRSYYVWGDATREDRAIVADHAASRLPWISFKPPASWAAVASGAYDSDIRSRARRYAGYAKPVIATFNHEPQTDSGTPADFARAWTRIHDVMAKETGLRNVVSAPILGEWVFNPVNKRDEPGDYLTPAVLDRCHFVGIDIYQNQSGQAYDVRLGRVLSWLNAQGRSQKMIGLGETACTDDYGTPSGATWWNNSWKWAVANTARVGAISYFNSQNNNNSGNTWVLSESAAKLAAYRASLSSATACRL